MTDLSNKIAVVTGGSRGLGREMVLAFAKAGADVVIASRKLEACEEVAREVEKLGHRALPMAAHVGKWDDNDKLAEAAYKQFGRIDILVNNAGMSPLAPTLAETSEALFDKVIDVNFKGPFRLSVCWRPDDPGRRWCDHQFLFHRIVQAGAAHRSLRRRESGGERDDGGARQSLCAEGARELHRTGPIPH